MEISILSHFGLGVALIIEKHIWQAQLILSDINLCAEHNKSIPNGARLCPFSHMSTDKFTNYPLSVHKLSTDG